MQGIKQYECGCVQQKYEYGTCMTGLTICYKKPVIGQEEIRIKMSNYSLTLRGVMGLCVQIVYHEPICYDSIYCMDTVIYSTLHTAKARKDGVHKKI
jgi:hypothetical protein